ncbi:ABC transporter ATP-binding protein [soil metagenome]
MARIDLEDLAHSYARKPGADADYAVEPMNLTWDDGGAYALLGPSGCGKTTLLNIISGLVKPSRGRVLFDGQDVTDLSPEHRNIAQVFQFPVIYDTMSVYDNLAFPLRNRGVNNAEVKKRVQQVAELLELSGDLKYRASGLAADAKQKISLGRGLVRHDVAAILFDEPLTVIDPHLKWLLRSKLKQIHTEYHHTLIYVTHDQTEALTFADQVVVMLDGSVVQVGTPQGLVENPEHTFVGYFIGSPGMNLLPCALSAGQAVVGGERIALAAALGAVRVGPDDDLTLGIRPEFLQCSRAGHPGSVQATVQHIEDLGSFKMATATLGGQSVKAKLGEEATLTPGDAWLYFPPERTKLYVNRRAV